MSTNEEQFAAVLKNLEERLSKLEDLLQASFERAAALHRGEDIEMPEQPIISDQQIEQGYLNIFNHNNLLYEKFLLENRQRDYQFYMNRRKEKTYDEPELPGEQSVGGDDQSPEHSTTG